MFQFFGIAWVARRGVPYELAAYGKSCKSMTQAAGCERKKFSVRRSLLLSIGGGA